MSTTPNIICNTSLGGGAQVVTVDADPDTLIAQFTASKNTIGGSLVCWVSNVSGSDMARWYVLSGNKLSVMPIIRRHKLDATVDPGGNDNILAGFTPLSQWVNASAGTVWVCLSSSVSTASWKQIC